MHDDTETKYDPPNIEFLKNLPRKEQLADCHFTETWEQAFERVSKLPEPERSKLLKELGRLEAKERLRNIGENLPSTDDFLAQRRIDSRDD